MRKISAKKYAVSLYETVRGVKEDQLPIILENFIKLLIKNNDLSKANKVINAFNDYAKEKEGILDVEVKTAKPLENVDKDKIIEYLQKSFNKKIILDEKTDKKLIGGVVLSYKDTVIDGSIKKRLEILKESLMG